jgi:hypothetical protein
MDCQVLGLVKALLGRGVPIHGVGLQMHISVDDFPDPADVAKVCWGGSPVHRRGPAPRVAACGRWRWRYWCEEVEVSAVGMFTRWVWWVWWVW